jgi:hypothetical protein
LEALLALLCRHYGQEVSCETAQRIKELSQLPGDEHKHWVEEIRTALRQSDGTGIVRGNFRGKVWGPSAGLPPVTAFGFEPRNADPVS